MNKYDELIYSLIYNCNREVTIEEKKILNQASAIYNTYNRLEEQLGCPLEVYVGINQRYITTVYDKDGIDYTIKPDTIIEDSFMAVDGFTLIECKWNMYCKTWWLKEDKSE